MVRDKPNWLWTIVIIFLLIVIVSGGIVLWTRYKPEQPLEISIPHPQEQSAQIYIGGAVNSPGWYNLRQADSITSLIQAAGGANSTANLTGLELYIPGAGVTQDAQKIDINHAQTWLLEALPGIGPALAQRIVDYRQQNGPFLNIAELLKVRGIGNSVYQKIENLITVADH